MSDEIKNKNKKLEHVIQIPNCIHVPTQRS